MNLKSTIAGCLAGSAMALCLALPAAAETDLTALLPDAVREAGVLRVVASSSGNPPMIYVGEDARTLEGLEIELTEAVGEALGIEIEYVTGTFDSLIPSITADRADFAVGSIGDMKARQSQVDFVDYIEAGVGLAVAAGNPAGITDMASFCGHSVAVVRGTFHERQASKQKETCAAAGSDLDVQTFGETNAAVLALRSGRVEAWMGDSGPVGYVVLQSKGALEKAGQFKAMILLGYAVNKENARMRDALKAALDAVLASGRYREILDKWGQGDTAVEEITVNNALL